VKRLVCLGLVTTLGCGGGGGGGGMNGGGDGIDAGSEPGGPTITTLTTPSPSITEGERVTFTAIVADPDGVDDIAGGTLSLQGVTAPLGAFVQQAGGTYTIDVTWAQIAAARPIEFTADETRTFRAEFIDSDSRRGSRDATLVLTCGGDAACDSTCVDLQENAEYCGSCERSCRVGGASGSCSGGECAPAFTDCLETTQYATCDAACEALGESCADCGGTPGLYYRSRRDCSSSIAAGPVLSCDAAIVPDNGDQVRCCCTSTP
jgi:hypothetical protein